MKAYISGLEVEFRERRVPAWLLRDSLMRVADVKNPPYEENAFYLPRQDKPDGITADGLYQFDLEEWNKFTLVLVKDRNYEGLNLFNREVEQKKRLSQMSPARTVGELIELLKEYPAYEHIVVSNSTNSSASDIIDVAYDEPVKRVLIIRD